MKNILYSLLTLGLLSLGSCSKKIYTSPATMMEIMKADNFTFMAERANPTSMDVVNVMNNFPAGGSQRFLNLDYGYTLTLKNKKLEVDLPYFGRLYTPSFDNSKNSFRFTSEDFAVNKNENKEGNWQYRIVANDQSRQTTFNLEVYQNGRAYLTVSANDRQPISYDGYVMRNKPEVK